MRHRVLLAILLVLFTLVTTTMAAGGAGRGSRKKGPDKAPSSRRARTPSEGDGSFSPESEDGVEVDELDPSNDEEGSEVFIRRPRTVGFASGSSRRRVPSPPSEDVSRAGSSLRSTSLSPPPSARAYNIPPGRPRTPETPERVGRRFLLLEKTPPNKQLYDRPRLAKDRRALPADDQLTRTFHPWYLFNRENRRKRHKDVLDEIKRLLRDLDYSTNSHFALLIGRPEKNPAQPDESAELFSSRTIRREERYLAAAERWREEFRKDIAEPRREQHTELLQRAREEAEARERAAQREQQEIDAALIRAVHAQRTKDARAAAQASAADDTDGESDSTTRTRSKGKQRADTKGKGRAAPSDNGSDTEPRPSRKGKGKAKATRSPSVASSRAESEVVPSSSRATSEIIVIDSEDEAMDVIQQAVRNSQITYTAETRARNGASTSRRTLDSPSVAVAGPASVAAVQLLRTPRFGVTAASTAALPPLRQNGTAAPPPHTERPARQVSSELPEPVTEVLRALAVPQQRWLRFEHVWRTADPRNYEDALQALNEKFNLGLDDDALFDIVVLFSRHPPPRPTS